jgi:hypothetical protein
VLKLRKGDNVILTWYSYWEKIKNAAGFSPLVPKEIDDKKKSARDANILHCEGKCT